MEISYESLDRLLTAAASQLDDAAGLIRDLDLAPDSNIKKVGESLVNIFEIQHEIYAVRPDLCPDFLRKQSDSRFVGQRSKPRERILSAQTEPTTTQGTAMSKLFEEDRLDVWYDGSAICVIAVGANGDPLDLGEDEVEAHITKLHEALAKART